MKNNNILADQSLCEFLDDSFELPAGEIDLAVNDSDKPINDKSRSIGVVDFESLEFLMVELDALANHWFEQFKICRWLLELLEEIEQPNEDGDVEQLKTLIHEKISWLRWDKKELATASNEDEMKLLRKLTAKSIGPKPKVKKTIKSTAS